MKKETKNKENKDARRKLRELKEQYGLTWPQVAKIFGKSLSTIEAWYQGKGNIPESYKELINIYLENSQVFNRKLKK